MDGNFAFACSLVIPTDPVNGYYFDPETLEFPHLRHKKIYNVVHWNGHCSSKKEADVTGAESTYRVRKITRETGWERGI